MAIHASLVKPCVVAFQIDIADGQISDQIDMTPNTVILNGGFSRFLDADDLRFPSHGEDGRVAHPVLSLERVLAEDIILRYVTVVAGRGFPVTASLPGRVLGSHDVAVHAR